MSGLPPFHIALQRLLTLADHLETGQLGHKQFSICALNAGDGAVDGCGTIGCAIGECPIVFPEDWLFKSSNYQNAAPALSAVDFPDCEDPTVASVSMFFSLSPGGVNHLFYAYGQDEARFGGRTLEDEATKEEVAANIRDYVAIMKSLTDVKLVPAKTAIAE